MAPAIREPSHAGSWYTDDGATLSQQLDGWLSEVPSSTTPIGSRSSKQGDVSIPVQKARAIIAPHAGYSYSGPAAAWAYKSADWANAYDSTSSTTYSKAHSGSKRVFLLGPSHHWGLPGAATTGCSEYGTPLGNLTVDTQLVETIRKGWNLKTMSRQQDEDEHSLEMHLPYIYKMLSLHNSAFKSNSSSVPLVPILVGATNSATERDLGSKLAPYLADPTNLFIISSDFCHWGSRFRYTYYQLPDGSAREIRSSSEVKKYYPIHESIKAVDFESIDAVESGEHRQFLEQLEETGNTVCGRHPIGVFMAAVEQASGLPGDGKFKFLRYERSSEVVSVKDSSVSYASAFAVL
ncbi:hypothetical protein PMIN04_009830 [Paraphaeosphaeria minitans]